MLLPRRTRSAPKSIAQSRLSVHVSGSSRGGPPERAVKLPGPRVLTRRMEEFMRCPEKLEISWGSLPL
jgi:hypothetical protein